MVKLKILVDRLLCTIEQRPLNPLRDSSNRNERIAPWVGNLCANRALLSDFSNNGNHHHLHNQCQLQRQS